MELNNIASPMQSVRDVLDLMPTDSEDQWATISRRIAAVRLSAGGSGAGGADPS